MIFEMAAVAADTAVMEATRLLVAIRLSREDPAVVADMDATEETEAHQDTNMDPAAVVEDTEMTERMRPRTLQAEAVASLASLHAVLADRLERQHNPAASASSIAQWRCNHAI